MSGADYLLQVLAERGLSVAVGGDGTPRLRGPASEVTPALREMLALWRDELIERFRGPPPPPPPAPPAVPRLVEFLLPSGVIARCLPGHDGPRRSVHPFVPAGATGYRVPPDEGWSPVGQLPPEWNIPQAGRGGAGEDEGAES